jgi:hypothetical protein
MGGDEGCRSHVFWFFFVIYVAVGMSQDRDISCGTSFAGV